LEEQYLLARKLHISPIDSNLMAGFEREIFVNMVIKEMKAEEEKIENG
jgi:hypothetical protein